MRGTLSSVIHKGLSLQGSGLKVYFCTNVLARYQYAKILCRIEDLQDRVSDEEDEDADCNERQTTHVYKTSSCEYVAIARFPSWIRVVQVVILFHVFGKQ